MFTLYRDFYETNDVIGNLIKEVKRRLKSMEMFLDEYLAIKYLFYCYMSKMKNIYPEDFKIGTLPILLF